VCRGGGAHKYIPVTAENAKSLMSGGAKASFMGTGGGVKAKYEKDQGQRVILYCEKCRDMTVQCAQ
jgi:hypothetical protein